MHRWILIFLTLFLKTSGVRSPDLKIGDLWSTSSDQYKYEIYSELDQKTYGPLSPQETDDILLDHKRLIPHDFKITPYFSPFVRFWFNIYTRYGSDQSVIHDKKDLGIVYGILDFSDSWDRSVGPGARLVLQERVAKKKIEELKNILNNMAAKRPTTKLSQKILEALEHSSSPPPPDAASRRDYFLERAENIRTQTGQRDLIGAGIERMKPFEKFLLTSFKSFDLPPELLAIPFLESSFNHIAQSKSGALGAWQFMPLIASYFLPKRNSKVDYRLNPIISSVAAMHLLEENHRILKDWDLAVTAYNSGTKHLLLARRELGVEHPGLDEVLTKYDHPHLGFASKNFYSEFLALVYALAYKNHVFPVQSSVAAMDDNDISLAIARCGFKPSSHGTLKNLNVHLRDENYLYPRGTIVVVPQDLSDSKFIKVTQDQAQKWKPLQWDKKILRNYSCSTR